MRADSTDDAAVARQEHLALTVSALAAIAVIFWLIKPVGMGVLLGVLFAFTFRPAYERIARRLSPPIAALATVLGSTLTMALTFGGFVWILVRGGIIFARQAIHSLEAGGSSHDIVLAIGRLGSRVGVSSGELGEKARTHMKSAVVGATAVAQGIVSATAHMTLAVLFLMLTMNFILRRWHQVATALQETLPLRPEYTQELLREFRRVGRTTLLSTGVIGLLQGALATVGYWIVGLPQPLFLGVLTAITSLVPGVGTMLVWLPATLTLLLLGHVGSGVVLLVWSLVVMSAIPTYVIRPHLIGRGGDSGMPALFTFISLFGGVAIFGLKGLIIGPVLIAIAMAILRLYAEEARTRRHILRGPM